MQQPWQFPHWSEIRKRKERVVVINTDSVTALTNHSLQLQMCHHALATSVIWFDIYMYPYICNQCRSRTMKAVGRNVEDSGAARPPSLRAASPSALRCILSPAALLHMAHTQSRRGWGGLDSHWRRSRPWLHDNFWLAGQTLEIFTNRFVLHLTNTDRRFKADCFVLYKSQDGTNLSCRDIYNMT